MKSKKKTKEKSNKLYKEEYVFFIYECARKGMLGTEIAKSLEINYQTFNKWLDRYPIARMAMDMGKEANKDKGASFRQYMLNQMTEEQREVWTMIEAASIGKTGFAMLDEITKDQGQRAMQTFYLQALVSCNFNSTRACAMVGINFKELREWSEDPFFADMVSEIEVHKKNFFEDAFVDLAATGHAGAIIHANKSLNADRGYNEKKTITHEGTINHGHLHMDIFDLDLSPACKKEILGAIRKHKEQKKLEPDNSSMKPAVPA